MQMQCFESNGIVTDYKKAKGKGDEQGGLEIGFNKSEPILPGLFFCINHHGDKRQ